MEPFVAHKNLKKLFNVLFEHRTSGFKIMMHYLHCSVFREHLAALFTGAESYNSIFNYLCQHYYVLKFLVFHGAVEWI